MLNLDSVSNTICCQFTYTQSHLAPWC